MKNNLEYGPVICVKGVNKVRIGYFDCEETDCSLCSVKCCRKQCNDLDAECDKCAKYPSGLGKCKEYGVVYWGDMLLCSSYTLIPLMNLSNSIPLKSVADRIKELSSLIMKGDKRYQTINELLYCQVLFYEKHIKSLYSNKEGKHIFISHSSKDKQFANFLYADLVDHGFNPWLDDRDIIAGQSISHEIQSALQASDYIIVVLSSKSVEAAWVEREWETVLWDEINQQKIKVIPALLEDCNIPTLLKTKKHADFRNDYDDGFFELLKSISDS